MTNVRKLMCNRTAQVTISEMCITVSCSYYIVVGRSVHVIHIKNNCGKPKLDPHKNSIKLLNCSMYV